MSVRIKLITRDEEYKVDESPIYVPADLKKYGLSEVVNQLLENADPVPFDFLVDGKLLRGSLQDYLTKANLSTESIVCLEYVRAIQPPTYLASYEHDDWVSSVHISQDHRSIVTGSYDGCVRIWDSSANIQHTFSGHQGPVLCTKWVTPKKVVSGGRDNNLHIWNTEGKELSGVLKGHAAPVTCVASLSRERFVSGSQDKTIRLWSSRLKELPEYCPPDSSSSATNKRRRIAEKQLQNAKQKGSFACLEGHTAPVHGLAVHPIDKDVVYSVSEDHTVKTWDLVTTKCVDTKTTGFSLLSIASLGPTTQLLACGSSARHIMLVDPRSTTHASVKQLYGHKNFVVSIAPSPTDSYQFASASHDGTVRLWDVRADKALFVIDRQGTGTDHDIYCVDWAHVVAAGGRDKKLELTNVQA